MPEEVECLIQTLLEMDTGPWVMTSTHLETQGLFEEMSAAMRWQSYRRTAAQIRAEFKREKAGFFDALEDWHSTPPQVHQGHIGFCHKRRPLRQLLRRLASHKEPTEEEKEEAVVLSSAQESEAGEGQQPGPAAVPIQVGEERMRAMEAKMVNIRQTLNRHSYRLGFVQRGMVCLCNMVQRSCRGRRRHAGRGRVDTLGRGVPEAPRQDSPPASEGEEMHSQVVLYRLGWAGLCPCIAAAQLWYTLRCFCTQILVALLGRCEMNNLSLH
ncbi:UNVERIFIED_CONTAM: hypothetical protein K2H54_043739 [Gekko kuhli]